MTGSELARLFTIAHRAVGVNLENVSDGHALQALGEANPINWVLGHIVAWRHSALELLGAEPVWDAATRQRYSGEGGAEWSAQHAVPLADLRAALDTTQERLLQALSAVTVEVLAQPRGRGTVGDSLAFLHFHEAYHAGQLGMARRLVGLPGQIRPPKSGH
jgi:uncharacterized damage-inducible protein DinB